MTVIFTTNIDSYKLNCFPSNLEIPPRIGEKVRVKQEFLGNFLSKKLPTDLEVVNVTWMEGLVICELWYSKHDIEVSKISNIDLFQ